MAGFNPRSDIGQRYLNYVTNRARVWAEKYVDGKKPDYRGDEVLRRYHFCNVWRELDRYSQWEIARIRGRPLQEQLDVIVIGRLSMVPRTVEMLIAGVNYTKLKTYVVKRQEEGLPWYNGALQIRCRGGSDYAMMFIEHRDAYLKHRRRILDLTRSAKNAGSLADAFNGQLPHVGPFRAYELATSLTYSEHLPYLHESQLFHVGPGARDGLAMLTGNTSATRDDFEQLRQEVFNQLDANPAFRWIPLKWQGNQTNRARHKFTLRTLEDSLCEFRKYTTLSGASGGTVAKKRAYHQYNIRV